MTHTTPVSLYQAGAAKCVCLSYTQAGGKSQLLTLTCPSLHMAHSVFPGTEPRAVRREGTTVGRWTEHPVSTSAPSVLKRELWHNVHAHYSDSQNRLVHSGIFQTPSLNTLIL